MQDPIDDRIGQIAVVKHRAPALWVLVRRKEHRALLDVLLVDDVEQQVGRGVAVAQPSATKGPRAWRTRPDPVASKRIRR